VIISRTPFRISFFGGGTDYPAWYSKHGGSVIATTIDKYCYLSCRHLPPFFDHKIRVVYSKIENCERIDQIEHPAIRDVLRFMKFDRGVEIHHDGDLPARSGMGSSSAFTVGVLHALYALKGHMPNKRQLALVGIHVEQEILKETVGSQDQVSAAYGGFNHIQFLPNGEISVTPITIPNDRVRELNAHLMLIYTGIKRTASTIAQTYVHDIEPYIQLCSTSEVYGQVRADEVPISEDAPLRPASPVRGVQSGSGPPGHIFHQLWNENHPDADDRYVNPRRADLFASSFARQIA
jgi:D-glycero-alpha-D-manno-heptose-7-phosphate kinase